MITIEEWKAGFHTTQYDLNDEATEIIGFDGNGFHTTQYDLNPFISFVKIQPLVVFPYYIVRFKLIYLITETCIYTRFHTTQYDLNLVGWSEPGEGQEFPYYIVRFKLFACNACNINQILFPYYIVRFKPYTFPAGTGGEKGFHTTQYDLNLCRRIEELENIEVSILHSTI